MKRIDYLGSKFGRWEVISDVRQGRKVLCKCECGSEQHVAIYSLKNGDSSSCGCYRREFTQQVGKKKTHGLTGTRIYAMWRGMISRCYSDSCENSKYYKGKGITVCDEWKSDKQSFFDWAILNGYSDDLTIDRIDNSKGYSPDNCRFSDIVTQNNNKTNNVRIHGKTFKEYAAATGINEKTLRFRAWKEKQNVQTQ